MVEYVRKHFPPGLHFFEYMGDHYVKNDYDQPVVGSASITPNGWYRLTMVSNGYQGRHT